MLLMSLLTLPQITVNLFTSDFKKIMVLTDIPGKLGFFDALPEYGPELFENKKSKSTLESAKKFLALAAERLAALPGWDDESILEAMKSLAEAEGVKNAAVMWPVRMACLLYTSRCV